MELWLKKGEERLKRFSVDHEMVIGRSEESHIQLEDRAISRKHIILRPKNAGIEVEKKSSFGSLTINGVSCQKAVLKQGDVLSFGPYCLEVTQEEKKVEELQNVAESFEDEVPKQALHEMISDSVPEPSMNLPLEQNSLSLSAPMFGEEEGKEELPVEPVVEMHTSEEQAPDFPSLSLSGIEEEKTKQLLSEPTPESESLSDSLSIPSMSGITLEPISESDSSPKKSLEMDSIPEMVDFTSTHATPKGEATSILSSDRLLGKLYLPEGSANLSEYEILKDRVTLGRDGDCDLVLFDKKSSRVNSVIEKEGRKFFIRDEKSLNGTYVNGQRIDRVELQSDDIIQIGNLEIRFTAFDEKFAKVKAHTPQEKTESGVFFESAPPEYPKTNEDAWMPKTEVSSPALPPKSPFSSPSHFDPLHQSSSPPPFDFEEPSILKKWWRKFQSLPKRKRILYLLVAIAILLNLGDFEENKTPPKEAQNSTSQKRSFDQLSSDEKKFIQTQHKKAFDHYQKKEYDEALFEVRKIFDLVDDYKDSRKIESFSEEAKKRLELAKEELRRKLAQDKILKQVQALEKSLEKSYASKNVEQMKAFLAEITKLDPEYSKLGLWQQRIDEIEEAKRLRSEARRNAEELNLEASKKLSEGRSLYNRGRYYPAIDKLREVEKVGAPNSSYESQARNLIRQIQNEISEKRDPFLLSAKQFEESGELKLAYDAYEKATKVDPKHPEGYAGMRRLKDALHQKAKVLYAEGVIAESYSDFELAKSKFEECMKVAPPGDLYHARAKRKLNHYFLQKGVQ